MTSRKPKIAFGMIVFEGDYVLEACLKQVYNLASQILISEGPVKFWQNKGRKTSGDNTNNIIDNFPDPENKIKIIHGQFNEKDEQCAAYMKYINSDIDYLWNLDSDEVYHAGDIENLINIMEKNNYTSADIRSCSFYGGFDRYIGGFEERKGNFHRVFKVYPGSRWLTHRPPTVIHDDSIKVLPKKHLDGDTLWYKYGIRMYHYSYVFPNQVLNKIEYYKAKVSKENCIDNYFENVYYPWIKEENLDNKFKIEKINEGVHEFKVEIRSSAYTKKFEGKHPIEIEKNILNYVNRIKEEIVTMDSKEIVECWRDERIYQSMLDGANGKLWEKLENSDHWPILKSLLDYCYFSGAKKLCDIGCGAGSLGRIYKSMEYTGVDLDNIIQNVAKKHYNGNYISCDIVVEQDLSFLKEYDCIISNAFFDILKDPLIIEEIMKHSKKFIIIHRQNIGEDTNSYITNSYNGLPTYRSQIGKKDLEEIIDKYNFSIHSVKTYGNQYSFILEKQ